MPGRIDEATIRLGLFQYVPEHLQDGLLHYIVNHWPVGGFLTAVLSNDFVGAVNRADPDSARRLYGIGLFLSEYAPEECYGSPQAVEAWLARFGGGGDRADGQRA